MKRLITCLVPLALLALSAVAQTTPPPATASGDAVSLKRMVKAGQTIKYKLEAIIYGENQGNMSATMTQKVLTVAENGDVTQLESVDSARIKIGELESALPSTSQTVTYSALNGLVDVKGDDMDEIVKPSYFRLHQLQALQLLDKPLKIGDSWSIDSKAEPANDNVASHADFTVDGMDKVNGIDCLHVKGTTKQTSGGEATSTLTYWIEPSTGITVKVIAVLKMVKYPKFDAPVDTTITLTRIDG